MPIKNIVIISKSALRKTLHRLAEPNILFPIFAILFSAILWLATLNIIDIERAATENAVQASVRELTETYEAQVVRVLREIDQELKLVQYAYLQHGQHQVLEELEARELLPPAFLFTISILNPDGMVIASTQAPDTSHTAADYLKKHRQYNQLYIAPPQLIPSTGEWKLEFSRKLTTTDGSFAGVVALEVDAAFFVSGYELSKMGHHGLLAILGTDGIFRARRTGETTAAGDTVNYAHLVPNGDTDETLVTLANTASDGVERYLSARALYDFPLAVVVGLSKAEQFIDVSHRAGIYLRRAATINVAILLILGLLWWMSHQLAQIRRRELEARITHAEKVEYLAYHDGLTGLANRSLFSKLLGQSISQARRYHRKLAVLFLDLDRFKTINDTLGHEVGDQLLQEVADRLKGCLRDSDTVARLGGDEFVVLLPELANESYVSIVARKIITATAKPFNFTGQEFRITASVGISVFPDDGQDEQTLTKNADVAMYHVKEEGKNNFEFYSEKLHAQSLQRLALESSLRGALERGEFQLHYQAKQDVGSGAVTGMEALLRWQHPDLGIVPPMQFIPVAEESGLIIPIGRWVLNTACEQNMAWQRQGLPKLSLAINLTSQQFFDANLTSDIASALENTGMEAGLLELEINESLLMRDVQKALMVINNLKDLGVRIAIDDFGVGYSSLSMLKQFPLDAIKIDRTFIRDVANIDEDRALTKAIVAMGHTLSLNVVAQGVETKEQAEFLRHYDCDQLQGFYFNKPIPADEFTKLLQADQDQHHI